MHKNIKTIEIKYNSHLFIEEEDESQVHNISVVRLFLGNKKAYLYFAQHGGVYENAFGNHWKTQNEEDESLIWFTIDDFDVSGYICLNDIYDDVNDDYESEKGKSYESIEDYALKNKTEPEYVVVKFVNEILSNLDLLDFMWDGNSDREIILQSILHIYISNPEFFNKYIFIGESTLEKLSQTLSVSEAITTYQKDKLAKVVTAKRIKIEKKNKI